MNNFKGKSAVVQRQKFDVLSFIVTLIAGIGWFFLGELLYSFLKTTGISRPVIIGVYFFGLGLLLVLSLLVSELFSKTGKSSGKEKLLAFLLAFVVFGAAVAFEAIYDIGIRAREKNTAATAYIFLVDDSGSMCLSDEDGTIRDKAIKEVMRNETDRQFPFCVYRFGTHTTRLSDMTPARNAGQMRFGFDNNAGGTNYIDAISTVLKDLSNKEIKAGSRPAIILVSDGAPESVSGLNKLLRQAYKSGVVIHTVGVGSFDQSVLQRVAEDTCGKYCTVDSIKDLSVGIATVVGADTQDNTRTLIGYRESGRFNALLFVERLVFLTVLNCLFFGIKLFLLRERVVNGIELIRSHVVAGVISVLGIEIGINGLHLPQAVMRLILCIGFTLIILNMKDVTNSGYRAGANVTDRTKKKLYNIK